MFKTFSGPNAKKKANHFLDDERIIVIDEWWSKGELVIKYWIQKDNNV